VHSIGRDRLVPLNPWIERRIFPGAYPPTLREMMEIFEPNGFSVLDVENIRLHYARTLEHWLERYEANADAVRSMFDEAFVRAWRLYLAGSIKAFEHGTLQLFQVLFSRSGMNAIPWTRDHLYLPGD
jgi:cyclopropane-fatty-acyl-phospholipid synthase